MTFLVHPPGPETATSSESVRESGSSRHRLRDDSALLVDLLNALLQERWLPIGLRTLLVHELPGLRSKLESSRPVNGALAEQLDHLHQAVSEYGEAVQRSDTVRLLMELRRGVALE